MGLGIIPDCELVSAERTASLQNQRRKCRTLHVVLRVSTNVCNNPLQVLRCRSQVSAIAVTTRQRPRNGPLKSNSIDCGDPRTNSITAPIATEWRGFVQLGHVAPASGIVQTARQVTT